MHAFDRKMTECIDACLDCHRVCLGLAMTHCLETGGEHVKPQHFRDMAKVVWQNRDNLGYAWQVISKGVCDGCALGVAGLHDWTVKGPHLCMTRLNLLRLNTMPALDHRLLSDPFDEDKSAGKEHLRLGRVQV